ncbi:hypothetical protein KIPB_003434 [Kipferlia bialata]|uniref:Uncharacterized protein n=1 Tax=Kipferlia bialata TaxID=797122 RepID=A0A9K3GFR4_9EUKA|nr:hypothetical protein KIPB_003434 [Kipferlia bialata]|eukprot:g3434.t1
MLWWRRSGVSPNEKRKNIVALAERYDSCQEILRQVDASFALWHKRENTFLKRSWRGITGQAPSLPPLDFIVPATVSRASVMDHFTQSLLTDAHF